MQAKPYVRKANYYETDRMAIIHHSNYIRWFEEARVDFMEQMGYGYDKANAAGIDFAVLGVACEYRSMVRFGETVCIETAVTRLTPSRMTVSYAVRDKISGELRCHGETRHCYYDNQAGRPVSLKKVLPELYAKFDALKQDAEKLDYGGER